MAIQVYSNIYKLEIPLPNNPLRALNCYVICSEERNLIIDTGFNSMECKNAFIKGIQEVGVNLDKTDLLITHLHSDHSGLAADLNKEGVNVYAGRTDGKMINAMIGEEYWKRFDDYKKMFDLDKDNISIDDHPGYKFSPKEPVDFIYLNEGNIINIGNYAFEVIDIPGHTPGHIGLYERNHKIFFCGDHILDKITPNITFWGFNKDILSTYIDSLKKVYEFDINYLLTAHRGTVYDYRKRINELYTHHQNRLKEIRDILKDSKKSVRDTAAEMHWELRYDEWDKFPNPQKWFAAGEAMSHLEHLVYIGEAVKTNEQGILYYRLKV